MTGKDAGSMLENFKEVSFKLEKPLSEVTEIVPSATFIQHVTHEIFKQMMKVQFPQTTALAVSKTAIFKTFREVNAAVCCIAGYVRCILSMIVWRHQVWRERRR